LLNRKIRESSHLQLVPKIAGAILTIFQKAFQKKALKTVLDHEKAKANFH
jgi:hypothetical protein